MHIVTVEFQINSSDEEQAVEIVQKALTTIKNHVNSTPTTSSRTTARLSHLTSYTVTRVD